MSDRIHTLSVVLKKNMRDDDAKCIIDAILLLKGVVKVGANISNPAHYAATEQAKHEIRMKLLEIIV